MGLEKERGETEYGRDNGRDHDGTRAAGGSGTQEKRSEKAEGFLRSFGIHSGLIFGYARLFVAFF